MLKPNAIVQFGNLISTRAVSVLHDQPVLNCTEGSSLTSGPRVSLLGFVRAATATATVEGVCKEMWDRADVLVVSVSLAEIGPAFITADPREFQRELSELYVQVRWVAFVDSLQHRQLASGSDGVRKLS